MIGGSRRGSARVAILEPSFRAIPRETGFPRLSVAIHNFPLPDSPEARFLTLVLAVFGPPDEDDRGDATLDRQIRCP